MPGPFAPTISANVAYESPVAPVKPAPTFLEGALGVAETGLKMYAQEQKAAGTRAGKPDPNLKLFSEEMDKVAQIRSSQGEMAGRLAERNVASNFAAAGIDLDTSYKAVYETKTGRSFEAYGRDDAAAFRESLLKDDTVRANLTASLSILPPNASFEERLEFAIGEKSKVESAAILVGRAKADATTNWTQAEGGYNTITDNFLSVGMGALVQREQSGVPITAQDIANLNVQWTQLKAGALSRPSYLGDDQWKSFSNRLDQVDKMFASLDKAASNEVLRASMTKYLADAINRSEGIEPTQKAVAVLGALSGDAAILGQLGGRFGDVAEAMSKAKVIELPSANIFGQSLFAPGKPAPGPNSAVTKDDLPPEIAQKYSNMSAPDRVNQMKADGTYSSLFSSANMGNPENREAFAQRAMSLGTTMLSGGTDEFLSSQFLRQGVANPKFISSIKALELQDADLGMKTKTIVRSGLLTEKLRQNANLGSVENRIQGAKFNEQTGRYEIDAEFFRRKEDLAAFNADLNEFYAGDLGVAARDNFSKIEAKYAGFRVSGVNATNVIRLGRLNAIPEALKRRDAIRVIDGSLNQLADPIEEDILEPITDTVDQTPSTSDTAEDRSVLQRVGDVILGSPAAAAELSPQSNGNLESKIKEEIRSAEGFRDKAYIPTKGDVPTIGFGFTEGVKQGDTITREQAEERLTEEVNSRLTNIRNEITDFDKFPEDAQVAMFSSWYRGSLEGSPKTISLINEGKYDLAADEFLNNDEYKNAVSRGRRGIRARMEKTADAIRSLMPEGMSDEDFVSQISKALTETPTERRVREAQARQAAKEAYYRSLNQ
jgi:lysozyme